MVTFPQIQIRQTYGRIGIDADLGQLDMRQPRPTMELRTTRPELSMQQYKGDLTIDQSRAWDALGIGSFFDVMDHIRSESHRIAMEGIARRVENGNRLAAIHTGANAIADIAREQAYEFQEFNYAGPASFDNVDISYTQHKADVEVRSGTVEVDARVNPPEVNYIRGKLDIYLLQRNNVEIIPPQLDIFV